jgi:hypothetical protein
MRTLLTAAACLALAGCGGDGKPATVPVAVTVTHKGQPAAGALVVFHPAADAREKEIGGKPFGKVKPDGTVAVTTYQEGDGAPEGEYGVTVQWTEAAPAGKLSLSGEGGGTRDKLGGKYGDPRAPKFKVTVKRGDANQVELKLE